MDFSGWRHMLVLENVSNVIFTQYGTFSFCSLFPFQISRFEKVKTSRKKHLILLTAVSKFLTWFKQRRHLHLKASSENDVCI